MNLKVLFVIRAAEHFSRYESIISSLCLKGHNLTMFFDKEWSDNSDCRKLDDFKIKTPNFNYGWVINGREYKNYLLFITRSLLTYRRFLTVRGQSSFFRDRWKAYMPFWLRSFTYLPFFKYFLKQKAVYHFLMRAEKIIPPNDKVSNQIKEYSPDVLISPVGGIRVISPSIEYLKAAVAFGIPTVSPTISWDSLTTKSVITVFPDVFLLWNESHRKEAMEHHNIPPEKIKMIGASVFDKWFGDSKPSLSRDQFCEQSGLETGDYYILYLGPAKGTAVDDSWLIKKIRRHLDESRDLDLRRVKIMVRPHPANSGIYKDLNMKGVVVFPRVGELPDTKESFQTSFNSYYYSLAATGVFTSAMMEAIIMGKPVIVMLADEFRKTQLEAQHFQHFVESGAVDLTADLNEFSNCIKDILSGKDNKKEKRARFVKDFIRPQGLEKSAGELAVEEIENLVTFKVNKNK